jgi:hypothetical protein
MVGADDGDDTFDPLDVVLPNPLKVRRNNGVLQQKLRNARQCRQSVLKMKSKQSSSLDDTGSSSSGNPNSSTTVDVPWYCHKF